MNDGIIYLITNEVNGKKYVGQTIIGLKKRFLAHCYGNETPISKAIKKYGQHNFFIETLEETKEHNKLNELELKWMKKLNSFAPTGYNISPAISPWDRTPKRKRKIIRKMWSERGKLQYPIRLDMRKMWKGRWEDYRFFFRKAKEWDERWFDREELTRLYEQNIKKLTDHEKCDDSRFEEIPWIMM